MVNNAKRYLLILTCIFFVSFNLLGCQKLQDIASTANNNERTAGPSSIVYRNDKFYEINSEIPFEGIFVATHRSGQNHIKCPIKAGERQGECLWWNEDGMIVTRDTFVNNRMVEHRSYGNLSKFNVAKGQWDVPTYEMLRFCSYKNGVPDGECYSCDYFDEQFPHLIEDKTNRGLCREGLVRGSVCIFDNGKPTNDDDRKSMGCYGTALDAWKAEDGGVYLLGHDVGIYPHYDDWDH